MEARFDDIAYRIEPYLNERFSRLRKVMSAEMDLMKQAYSYDKYNYEEYFKYLYDESRIGYQLRWNPKGDPIFASYMYGILVNGNPPSRREESNAFFDLEFVGGDYCARYDLWGNYDAYMKKSYEVLDVVDNSLRVLRKYDNGQKYDPRTNGLGPNDFDLGKY